MVVVVVGFCGIARGVGAPKDLMQVCCYGGKFAFRLRLVDGHRFDFLGVHLRTVRLWQARFRKRGKAGLRLKPPPGSPRTLTARQERTVLSLLRQSPHSFDFSTDLWSARYVAEVIERK
jgi:hypothetical protein